MNKEFTFHLLNENGKEKASDIAILFNGLLENLKLILPEGRELSLVRTKLEEAFKEVHGEPARESAMTEVEYLEHFDFSIRVRRYLVANRVTTVHQLKSLRVSDLLRSPNFGRVALSEIKDFLAERNLTLTPEPLVCEECATSGKLRQRKWKERIEP